MTLRIFQTVLDANGKCIIRWQKKKLFLTQLLKTFTSENNLYLSQAFMGLTLKY